MTWREVDADKLASLRKPILIDVRSPGEYAAERIPGAINVPLSQLVGRENEFALGGKVYVICQAGGRSMRACEHLSNIEQLSDTTFVNIAGGTGGWIIEGHEVTEGDTPS